MDSPARLKQTQMRGRVLEISTTTPDRVMRILKSAQKNGDIPLDEVALYGAQIHVVIPDSEKHRDDVRRILESENIPITSLEWIEPTLEDVFISAVSVTHPSA
jgi:hypothetical protein